MWMALMARAALPAVAEEMREHLATLKEAPRPGAPEWDGLKAKFIPPYRNDAFHDKWREHEVFEALPSLVETVVRACRDQWWDAPRSWRVVEVEVVDPEQDLASVAIPSVVRAGDPGTGGAAAAGEAGGPGCRLAVHRGRQ